MNSPATDAIPREIPRRSHSCFTRYNPIPVPPDALYPAPSGQASLIALPAPLPGPPSPSVRSAAAPAQLPVNPRSVTRRSSWAKIPGPSSRTEIVPSAARMLTWQPGQYFAQLTKSCFSMKHTDFLSE